MKRLISWRSALVIAAMMVLPVILLVSNFHSGTELVRLRNAMVFNVITVEQSQWPGDQFPPSFKQENAVLPDAIARVIITPPEAEDPLTLMLRQAAVLNLDKRRRGGAISADISTTLAGIQQQRGYCADYTEIINVFGHALNIPVREWALAFDGFGGHGHAINEIWDQQARRWIMLDVFNGFYPVDQQQQPMSVLEFKQQLIADRSQITLVRLSDQTFGFKSDAQALDYYYNGRHQFYLWWANNNISYDKQPLIKLAAKVSPHLEQLVAVISGQFPQLMAIAEPDNLHMINNMQRLKYMLWTLFFYELLLALLLLAMLITLFTRRRSRKK
ncbi:hypothetical protein [Arsukibacterium indicum]|uniref:Transglutaminase-like domain-containing protein n=1 Tax=Arsukibacterium indicum TaxID=2848612 RepID=A0ABS6MH54_9GAMM|nr:hypothetical protein [Arsukibacterium indicum]MBV2127699.1 hypothetical protein [Arsukibacterium indicum]